MRRVTGKFYSKRHLVKRPRVDQIQEKQQLHYKDDYQLGKKIVEAIEKENFISDADKKDIWVTVESGVVILRGVVYSHNDRTTIANIASGFVGADNIIDQLEEMQDQRIKGHLSSHT